QLYDFPAMPEIDVGLVSSCVPLLAATADLAISSGDWSVVAMVRAKPIRRSALVMLRLFPASSVAAVQSSGTVMVKAGSPDAGCLRSRATAAVGGSTRARTADRIDRRRRVTPPPARRWGLR